MDYIPASPSVKVEFQNLIRNYFAQEGNRDKKGRRKSIIEYIKILDSETADKFTYAWKLGDARGFFINRAIHRFSHGENWDDIGITAEILHKSFETGPTSESELALLRELRIAIAEQVYKLGVPDNEHDFEGYYKTLRTVNAETHHKILVNKPFKIMGRKIRVHGKELEVKEPVFKPKSKDEVMDDLIRL
ncbi:MAG: hypothetical protein KKG59_03195 [Nanoarchaeota archaeon]|nr:hypothetical protein [Nanoarchaeota archaeon]